MRKVKLGNNITLYNGDFRDVMDQMIQKEKRVDAIISDPPYAKASIPLYEAIMSYAEKILWLGSSILLIVPTHSIPYISNIHTTTKSIKYRHTICMWQMDGPHSRMAMGIEVVWKPIIWWVYGSYPSGRGFTRDGFVNSIPNKVYHKWQQSLSWARFCINILDEGDIIMDPMLGSGTTAIAAHKSNHEFIGVELEESTFDLAIKRIMVECNISSEEIEEWQV